MADFGIDKLAAQLGDLLAGQLRATFDFMHGQRGWSPIEALFYIALTKAAEIDRPVPLPLELHRGRSGIDSINELLADPAPRAVIFMQCWLLDWPVDFVIAVTRGGRRSLLAIECDGHEFHERTKEQAAKDRSRDRSLQQIGCRVYRFTGSELYRDPLKCADEALRWIGATSFEMECQS